MSSEQLQQFFESLSGQIITVLAMLLLFGAILFSGRKKKTNAKALAISAIFIALYLVLNQITLFRFPQGGSITACSMLMITYCAYLLGTRRAVMAGMCAGLVGLIFNPYVIHPLQLLLDYPLAVGALGLGGFLANRKGGLFSTYLIGACCRLFCTFLSGVIFFAEYTPDGWNNCLWSFWYNFCYIGTEAALTLLVLCIPPLRNGLAQLKSQISDI